MTDDREQKSENFDRRLGALSEKLDAHKKQREVEVEDKGLKDRAGMAYGLKIASEFVSAIIVGATIGWVIDQWVGSSPLGLIGFLLLGFAAGILNVMRATGQVKQPEE